MPDIREVKASRIRPLHFRGRVRAVAGIEHSPAEILDSVAQEIAAELTKKLLEFNEVKIWEEGAATCYDTTLEVILPETPGENRQVGTSRNDIFVIAGLAVVACWLFIVLPLLFY